MFEEETAKALEHFVKRCFDDLEFVEILIVGKTLREEQILLAVGLTTEGEKIILGFVEAQTESYSCVVRYYRNAASGRRRHCWCYSMVQRDCAKVFLKSLEIRR